MGAIDLSVRHKAWVGQSHEWLASAFGTDMGRTVTLNLALFTTIVDERIPSGTLIGKVTATSKYGPYNNALATGQEVAAGILLMDVDVKQFNGATPTGDVVAPMLWRGDVYEAKLPAGSGVDTTGKADLASRISFT